MAGAAASTKVVRWGVMGTAGIADVVLPAIAAAPNACVVACASRDAAKAASWAKEREIPRSYGSYQALLEDTEVDVVYMLAQHTMTTACAHRISFAHNDKFATLLLH